MIGGCLLLPLVAFFSRNGTPHLKYFIEAISITGSAAQTQQCSNIQQVEFGTHLGEEEEEEKQAILMMCVM